MSRMSLSFLNMPSKDDVQAAINIICCLLGIGSLGMQYDFAKGGPYLGTIALLTMFFINVYATVLLSKCFLHVPAHVVTFSDLGFYVGGKTGRIAIQITQLGTCLTVPIAFLVLGSYLLGTIFDGVIHLSNPLWIILMALSLLPVALIRTLKENYWVMILGTVTTVLAVVIAIYDSVTSTTWDMYEATSVELVNVFPVFGSLSLAYGAAVIIPTIQREHPKPENMPFVIVASLGIITLIYLIIAVIGYLQYGCSSPPNLLMSMQSGYLRRFAFSLMQIHIMIAFSVLLNPAVFYIERSMFQVTEDPNFALDVESPGYMKNSTPKISTSSIRKRKSVSMRNSLNSIDEDMNQLPPYTKTQKIQSFALRSSVIAVQVFLAILGQNSFTDVVGLIGATTISSCCIILPTILYFVLFFKKMHIVQKSICIAVILISSVLAIYTTYIKLAVIIENASNYELFTSSVKDDPKPEYPYCPANYEDRMRSKGHLS